MAKPSSPPSSSSLEPSSRRPSGSSGPSFATALDAEAPWTWRLSDVLGLLSDRQRRYVELLPRIFQVKTAGGKVLPYTIQPYQAWWHAHAPLAMGSDAPSRLAEKGRGLGLTLMSAMDALLLAHTKDRITIPVAGRAGDTSDEFVEKTWDLIRDAHDPDFFAPRLDKTATVELDNRSRIIPLPGGSPEKSRSKRLIHGVLDEFAFHEYPDRLLKAIRGSQTEGGTLDVISTHNGSDTRFYDLTDRARTGQAPFKHFWFPIHDPKSWRQDLPVKDQVDAGLRLIAPWLSVRTLEEFRLDDPAGYAQEMLCEVMDATLNLLSRELVTKATDSALPDWGLPYVGTDARLHIYTVPKRPDGDLDPAVVGIDFARTGDLAAYTAWTNTPAGPWQRWLEVLRGVATPAQNELVRAIDQELRPSDILIDMTGEGAGLYDYAREDAEAGRIRAKVHGVHFSQGIHEGGGKTTPVKKAIALNLARGLSDRARLLGTTRHADLQRRHLLSVRRADLDAPRTQEGHGDILWANALALWGIRILSPTAPNQPDPEPLDVTSLVTNQSPFD